MSKRLGAPPPPEPLATVEPATKKTKRDRVRASITLDRELFDAFVRDARARGYPYGGWALDDLMADHLGVERRHFPPGADVAR